MNAVALPAIGDVLGDKYALIRQIGRGGMGVVFEGRHVRLGQRVALKFMQAEHVADRDAVVRFAREARAAARLTSPHVARIFDVGSTPAGVPYIVMELLEGHDLGGALKVAGGLLPIDIVVDWLLQACAGLAEAHAAGIVHRDLKPSNLFACDGFSGDPIVKVLDFGVSKFVEDASQELTSTEMMLGTPQYMSPEQVTVSKAVDHRTDIWALSVILYRAISGRFPYTAPNVTQLAVAIATTPPASILGMMPTIPRALGDAIHRGLAPAAAQRFADVYGFAEAIAPFGSGRWPVPTVPSARLSRARASAPSHPTPNAAAAVTSTSVQPAGVETQLGTLNATARDAASRDVGSSRPARRSWSVALAAAATLAVVVAGGGLATYRVTRVRVAASANSHEHHPSVPSALSPSFPSSIPIASDASAPALPVVAAPEAPARAASASSMGATPSKATNTSVSPAAKPRPLPPRATGDPVHL